MWHIVPLLVGTFGIGYFLGGGAAHDLFAKYRTKLLIMCDFLFSYYVQNRSQPASPITLTHFSNSWGAVTEGKVGVELGLPSTEVSLFHVMETTTATLDLTPSKEKSRNTHLRTPANKSKQCRRMDTKATQRQQAVSVSKPLLPSNPFDEMIERAS